MPLVAAMVGLTAVLMLAFVPVGTALDRRTQARTAADAAALAGAASGSRADAGRLASANGGELVDFSQRGDQVVVEVRVGDMTAHASARATGARGAGGRGAGGLGLGLGDAAAVAGVAGGGDRAGLAPAMLAALAEADGLLGGPVPVASGLRTHAEQEALWASRATNPYPVARPGTSDHERGLAIDVPRGFVDRLLSVAARAGLCHPLPEADPVHFVVCGA